MWVSRVWVWVSRGVGVIWYVHSTVCIFSTYCACAYSHKLLASDCYYTQLEICGVGGMDSCVTLCIPSLFQDNTLRVWKLNEGGQFVCVAVGIGHTHTVGAVAVSKYVRTCVHACILHVYTRCAVVGVSFCVCDVYILLCMCRYLLHVCVNTYG